jgi:hypothetical protein
MDGTIQKLRHQIKRSTNPITNDVAEALLSGRAGLSEDEQIKRLQVFAAAAREASEHGETVSDEVFAAVETAVGVAAERKANPPRAKRASSAVDDLDEDDPDHAEESDDELVEEDSTQS